MAERNQAYAKRCGDCAKITEHLYFTKVQDGPRKLFRMLCEECRKRY